MQVARSDGVKGIARLDKVTNCDYMKMKAFSTLVKKDIDKARQKLEELQEEMK